MTFSPRIPLDVADLIIDEVALQDKEEDRYQDLRSCAITCRGFLNPSRRHIFQSISFTHRDKYVLGKYNRFLNALSSSPEIAPYVHMLDIVDDSDNEDTVPCIITDLMLPGLLQTLKNIIRFRLMLRKDRNWDGFTSQLKGALASVILSPTLERLAISGGCNFPPVAAKWFMRIPAVRLMHVCFRDYAEEADGLLDQTFRTSYNRSLTKLDLSCLTLEKSQPLIGGLSGLHFATCELQRLRVGTWLDVPIATAIIKKHRTTLNTLELPHGNYSSEDVSHCFDIGMLTSLRTIKFQIVANYIFLDPFFNVTRILSKAKEDGKIEKIILDLSFHFHSTLMDSTRSQWERLDILLSGSAFTHLRVVLLTTSSPAEMLPKGYMKLPLWSFFSGMKKKGLLRVDSKLDDLVDIQPIDISS